MKAEQGNIIGYAIQSIWVKASYQFEKNINKFIFRFNKKFEDKFDRFRLYKFYLKIEK